VVLGSFCSDETRILEIEALDDEGKKIGERIAPKARENNQPGVTFF
jgi:hypothetical protein